MQEWKGPYRVSSHYNTQPIVLKFDYRVAEGRVVSRLKGIDNTEHIVAGSAMKRFEKEVQREAERLEATHDEPT